MMISQMNQSQLLHWIDMVSFAVVEIKNISTRILTMKKL